MTIAENRSGPALEMPAPPRSNVALVGLALVVALQFLVLAASLADYRVSVDSGYHVAMSRWYGEHGPAFWDHVNFAPAGRPNLQGPVLHVAIAMVGRLLGGGGADYVLANALLALLQWLAALVTAVYFARRLAGDWGALCAAALLTGNAFSSYSFAVGIPSGWTFILAPWTIHFFLERRLLWCIATTSLVIYLHLAGFATAPVGVLVAAVLTRRWRDMITVGAGVLLATAPYTIHVLRHLEWIRGNRGQAAPGLAPLLYILAAPALIRVLRAPRANPLWMAWAMEPAAWLLQNHLRYLGQVTLLCAVLGGAWVASVIARLPRRARPLPAAAAVLLFTVGGPLNESALAVNWRWLAGQRYPRYLDWSEAVEVAAVLDRDGLSGRLVSTYNPTQCIAIGAFTPLLLEKGHWLEVRPRHDPADQLSAGDKVYVLALAPDDALLRQFEQYGWLEVHGGSARTSVATLAPLPPGLASPLPAARQSIGEQARWIAARATNNVFPGAGLLADWRSTLLAQRTAAGRLQLATILYAYALESSDPVSASALRGASRGAGSLAYFLGDEGATRFVSDARHERMRTHAAALADVAEQADSPGGSRAALIAAFRTLHDDYFSID